MDEQSAEKDPKADLCPTCGAEIPPEAPEGMCPFCLLNAETMISPPAKPSTASKRLPPVEQQTAEQTKTPGARSEPVQEKAEAARPSAEPQFAVPLEKLRELFPDLEILSLLGAGGMGAVYRARQPRLDRTVALKVLTCPPEMHDDFSLRFEREAQVLARLNHPNIVTIYDFGEIDRSDDPDSHGNLFHFVMEFVDGADLNQMIRTGDLKPEQALKIVPQICDALQFAHDEGITHRDIKPANILVDKKGQVRIADFGLAKLIGAESDALGTGLTLTGTSMGTPHYMAPEQWETSAVVDHRADIYSLGVVFYEMLTGQRPHGIFDPPSRKIQVDMRIDEVVLKAMEKDVDLRYQQASEVKDDVTRVGASPVDRPKPKVGKGKRKMAVIVGVMLAAMMGVGAWWWLKQPDTDTDTVLVVGGKQRGDAPDSPFPLTRPMRPGLSGSVSLISLDPGNDPSDHPLADIPAGLDDVVAVDALQVQEGRGHAPHALALHADGRVTTWGPRLNDNLVVPPDLKPAVAIATFGGYETGGHSAALHADGTVTVWGGWEDLIEKTRSWTDVVAIASAGARPRLYGLTSDGRVLYSAGEKDTSAIPAEIQGRVVQISAQATTTAALLEDGSVRCWDTLTAIDMKSVAAARDVKSIAILKNRLFTLDTEGRISAHARPTDNYYPPESVRSLNGIRRLLSTESNSVQSNVFAAFSASDERWHVWGDTNWKRAAGVGQQLAAAGNPQQIAFVDPTAILAIQPTAATLDQKPLPSDSEPTTALPDNPLALPGKPGHLRAAGTMPGGAPFDLSKVDGIDDIVDVGGRLGEWVALRANGETISARGDADFMDINRVVWSFAQNFALIDREGKLRFPGNSPCELPAAFDAEVIVDAQLGNEHGIALTADGRALVFGKRYEEQVGDPTQERLWGTPRWPLPPKEVLTDIVDIAVTQTHAATLKRDGTLSVFGWEGVRELPRPQGLARIEALESWPDMLLLLDVEGHVWEFGLPRNPSPDQPVAANGKYMKKLSSADPAVELNGGCWQGESGRWYSVSPDIANLLESNSIRANRKLVASGGSHAGETFQSLLWIEPEDEADSTVAKVSASAL